MIETQEIKALGTLGYLLLPEPDSKVYEGCPQTINENQASFKEDDKFWKKAKVILEKALDEARGDPEFGEILFNMLLSGRRDPEVIKDIQDNLVALGVPIEQCQIKD